VDTISQFENDWTKAVRHGTVDSAALYEELHEIQTADGGADSPAFKTHLNKINADLKAREALSGLTITGVAEYDQRVKIEDNGGKWEVGTIHGQLTGVPENSGPLGNVVLNAFNNPEQYKHHDLYENGTSSIKASNVKQGSLGDCYFLASVADLAAQNPAAIRRMIAPGQLYGQYEVIFPGQQPVDIDKPNPFELEHMAQAGDGDWVNALEKAHRKLTGKELVESGGDGGDAITLLTGNKAESFDLGSAKLSDQLDLALKNKELVLAETKGTPPDASSDAEDWRDRFQDMNVAAFQDQTEQANQKNAPAEEQKPLPGLKEDHAYSVLAYDPVTKMVTVRDPEGGCTVANKYGCSADGRINLTLEQFKSEFVVVYHAPSTSLPLPGTAAFAAGNFRNS
jgi:hypothetical protein